MGVFAEDMTSAQEISAVRARLESAAATPGMLAASWDAFEVLRARATERADPGSPAYAAYMTAAAAAATARDYVGWAPSMPAGERAAYGGAGQVPDSEGDAAEALAGLATLLAGRLTAAARAAAVPADREALEQASLIAEEIGALLAGTG